MNKMKKFLIPIIVSVIVLLAAGCGGDTGKVTMNITDAPIDGTNVESVFVTVTGLSFHMSYMDETEEWIEVDDFDGPRQYDLLDLTGEKTSLLGEFVFPAGKVTQIRFMLDAVETGSSVPSNPGCYVKRVGDNTKYPLFVPSGSSSGFKVTGAFDVPVNDEVTVTVDFDVRKSVTFRNDAYKLQPTLRAITDGEAGKIAGSVTNAGGNTAVIFAYEDGDYSASELTTTTDTSVFANAVTSAVVETSSYVLPFLAEGTYDLAAALFDADGNYISGSVSIVENVGVTSGDTTTQNISFE